MEETELEHYFADASLGWGSEGSSPELRQRRRETEKRKKSGRRRRGFIARPDEWRGDTQWGACASTKPRAATGAPGRPKKGRRRWGGDRVLFTHNYRIATELILQITPKFSKEVENLQNWKLLNFSNSTTLFQGIFSNSTSILKFEFGVHLSIWIISKLLQILYVNLKNFEYQSWST